MVMQGMILVTILFILPLCIGLLPVRFMREEHQSMGMMFVSGWLTMFTLFQLVAIPFIVNKESFSEVVKLYTIMMIVFSLVAFFLGIKTLGNCVKNTFYKPKKRWGRAVVWLLICGLIVYQMYMSLYMQYLDGDDAFYVATTVIADSLDSMYSINPYYGYSQPLDIRHALSPVPIFIAWISRLTGIQGTVLSHNFIGPLFILLMYMIYIQIGKRLFAEKKQYVPVFVLLLIIWYLFGNVSLLTPETFAFTRTWQGKAMFGNLVVPSYFLWLLFVVREEMKSGEWIMLFGLSAVAAFTTSTGIFMVPVFMALAGLLIAIQKKKVVVLFEFAACCIPSLVYGILYLFLK